MPTRTSLLPGRETLPRFARDPLVFGTLCGLASALGYTAANASLNAVRDCDPVWVSAVKALPTVLMFGPVLLYRITSGRERFASRREFTMLVMAALICQVFGNVVFQMSLGVIGMALAVPLTLGTMIISGAIMGRVFLHESVTLRMAASTIVLIGAVFVLSLGAGDASKSVLHEGVVPSVWLVARGVGAACLSGVAYALLGVVIRYSVKDKMSIPMTLVTVTLTGVISLGAISLFSIGLHGIVSTPPADFWTMMLAGFFNALAFLALTKSLQLIPVIYVNSLNATQATMAAIAGVLIFAEASSPTLWFGVVLTVVGLILMQRRNKPPRNRMSPQTEVLAQRAKTVEKTDPNEVPVQEKA